MPTKRNPKNVKPTQVTLKIKRVNPDNIRSVPVNDILVNHSENEFFITLSSVEPPAILDAEDLKNINSIEALTRVKITVSPKFAELIVKTLSTNIEKHKLTSKKGKKK